MHHANIVISNGDCRDFVFKILKQDLNFDTKANPDFQLFESESFGILDARDLAKWVIGKPLLGETKVIFIITKSITAQAQNALLKILEEPPQGTYIFINLENLGGILPTLLSRVQVLDLLEAGNDLENKTHNFFDLKTKEKFSVIRSLSKKEDKNEMKELIKSLEAIAYKEKMSANQMKNILTAKIFASTHGSSPKMLLEWLACVI
jgi:DNA polymerase III delta prime subunit